MTQTFADEHSLTAAESAELARRQMLDVDDFCRLTVTEITGDHDKGEATYVVSQSGVSFRPVADSLLALLSSAERAVVFEQIRHRLSFPCSPVELVDFVRAVDHCFELPKEFVEAVTGVSEHKIETPDERAIRFAKMRASGMKGAEIAKIEGGISVTQANNLCRKGAVVLARQASQATSMRGQLAPQGVAHIMAKTKSR